MTTRQFFDTIFGERASMNNRQYNPIAQELNQLLDAHPVGQLLSGLGRRIYFPKGIVAQSLEAQQAGVTYNATQGIATEGGVPMVLPSVQQFFSNLAAREVVTYAPSAGVKKLRELWAEEIRKKNPSLQAACSLPVVTAGLTSALAVSADLFADAGDTVIIPSPLWGNYNLMFQERREAIVTTYPIFEGSGFNVDGLASALGNISAGGKAICLFNVPHNPTGYSMTQSEGERIKKILVQAAQRGVSIVAIIDDAYFGLQYEDGLLTDSLFALLADAHRNIVSVKIDGATKEEFVWGFRVGFITVNALGMTHGQHEALNKKIMGLIRSAVSNCNHAAQSVLLRVLQSPTHHKEKEVFISTLTKRYHTVRRILDGYKNDSALSPLPFNSGYFFTFRCIDGTAELIRQQLLAKNIGVIAIQNGFVRFTYSTVDEADLEQVIATIYRCAHAVMDARS